MQTADWTQQQQRDAGQSREFSKVTGNTIALIEISGIQQSVMVFMKITLASSMTLAILLLSCAKGFPRKDQHNDGDADEELSKTILEMLHIDRVSASHQVEPHPYMRQMYQESHILETEDLIGNPEGTLIQSYYSVSGEAASSLVA